MIAVLVTNSNYWTWDLENGVYLMDDEEQAIKFMAGCLLGANRIKVEDDTVLALDGEEWKEAGPKENYRPAIAAFQMTLPQHCIFQMYPVVQA